MSSYHTTLGPKDSAYASGLKFSSQQMSKNFTLIVRLKIEFRNSDIYIEIALIDKGKFYS